MLQLNNEALGGYCGGYQLGYPRGGPIWPPEQGMGRAKDSQEDTRGLVTDQGTKSIGTRIQHALNLEPNCNPTGTLEP